MWSYDTSFNVLSVATTGNGEYVVAGCGNYIYFFSKSGKVLWRNSADEVVWSVVISSGGKNVAAGSGNKVLFYNATPMLILPMSTPEFTPEITPKIRPFEEKKSTPRFDVLLVVVALVVHILWRREI